MKLATLSFSVHVKLSHRNVWGSRKDYEIKRPGRSLTEEHAPQCFKIQSYLSQEWQKGRMLGRSSGRECQDELSFTIQIPSARQPAHTQRLTVNRTCFHAVPRETAFHCQLEMLFYALIFLSAFNRPNVNVNRTSSLLYVCRPTPALD